jgi:hypothetical protein
MSLHFVFMWFFAINGFIYVLYLIFSGEWRLIFPNRKSLKESFLVVLHDLHLRKSAPPQRKYNAAQRIAYTGIIIMGLGSVLTGLSIYKPIQFHTLCSLLGGYEWARAEHFILTILFVLFFVVHVVQVILAGWNNFRSMVTGLDVLRPGKEILLQPVVINKEVEPIQFVATGEKIIKPETVPGDSPANDVISGEKKSQTEPIEPDLEPNISTVLPTDKNTTTDSGDAGKIAGE